MIVGRIWLLLALAAASTVKSSSLMIQHGDSGSDSTAVDTENPAYSSVLHSMPWELWYCSMLRSRRIFI